MGEEVSYLTDFLTGILQINDDPEIIRLETLKEKYDLTDKK